MRPGSKTLAFSSIFLSLVVCFVALVHVEVELHAHRQMLQVLSQQRADNFEPRKTVHEPITSSFHSDSVEGKLRVSYFIRYSLTETWRRVRFALILSSVAISIALPMLVCKIWWVNKCDKKHLEDEETERKQKNSVGWKCPNYFCLRLKLAKIWLLNVAKFYRGLYMYGVPSNNSSNNVATRSTAFEKSNSVYWYWKKVVFL